MTEAEVEEVPTLARTPWLRWVALATVTVSLVFGVGSYVLWNRAISEHCASLPDPELSLEEMVALKWRHEAWQRDPQPDASLGLAVRELSFLLQGRFDFDLALEDDSGLAHIRLAIPREDGQCWNVDYLGRIGVKEGVATLRPERVRVGEVDVTPLAGRQLVYRADDIEDPEAAAMLRNARRIDWKDGQISVSLHDRWMR